MLYGAHVSVAGGISTAIDRAEELGCDAVQVFTQSPRMWRPTNHVPEQLERFRARRAETGIGYVVCHALYLVNLAASDREIHKKSVEAMRASLETAAAIDADGVVFHVGSHLGDGLEKGLRRALRPLHGLLELTDERLWLIVENSAGEETRRSRPSEARWRSTAPSSPWKMLYAGTPRYAASRAMVPPEDTTRSTLLSSEAKGTASRRTIGRVTQEKRSRYSS